MTLRRFILPLLLLAAGGCTVAPKPVYRAHAVGGTNFWNNGSEVVTVEAGGIEMAMAFESYTSGLLVFQVEFFNHGGRNRTIDPKQFFFAAATAVDSSEAARHAPLRFHAIDPEKQLLQNDIARSREVARRGAETDTDALFSLLDLVADVATIGTEQTEEQKQTEIEYDQEMELIKLREARQHRERMQAINAGRYRWANETLRKTTLAPGQCIGGRVRFRPAGQGEVLTFSFPVGESILTTRYRVVKHTAKRGGIAGAAAGDDGRRSEVR